MNKLFKIFVKTSLCIVAAVTFVSCLMEKDQTSAPGQSVMIELSVSASEMTKGAPTDMEKVINSLRVYAFYGDRLAGYTMRQATTPGEPFYMDLELPETGKHSVTFYLIANEAEMTYQNVAVSLTEDMTAAQLKAVKFSAMATGTALPMYCIRTETIDVDAVADAANDEAGHKGHFVLTQKVNFELTRPIAKVSLFAAKTAGASVDPQILGIELLASGTRTFNYLFPQTEQTLNEIPSRANDDVLLSSAVAVTSGIAKGSSDLQDPDNYTPVIKDKYLYEVASGSDAWNESSGNVNEAVLHIAYSLGEGQPRKDAYVYLPPVLRNKHIKVCVYINAEGQIIINYVVADWEDNETQDIRFDYPTHSYLRENIPTSQEDLAAVPSAAAQMSEKKAFRAYFQMTYPENDSWTPTLIGLNASDCTVRVYDDTGKIEIPRSEWPLPASDEWYTVEVSPNVGHIHAGDEVMLAITYRAAGFDTVEYMMINGTDQNFYWPYSGTSVQDADYVIITMVN